MKCPYCGLEMSEGYIHCHNGLYDVAWKSNDKTQRKVIVPSIDSFFSSRISSVFYCPSCQIILKDVKEKSDK